MSLPEKPTAISAIDIRTTRPRLREGLRFQPKSGHDAVAWIRIEDDCSGRFHRIGIAEYEFLLSLDGVCTIEQARERAAVSSQQKHVIAPEQAESLMHWALSESLLAGQDSSQFKTASCSKSSLSWIKIPLISRNIQWIWPVTMGGWLFDYRAIAAVVAVWCMALCVVVLDHDRFLNDLSSVLEPSSWIRLAMVWVSLKILHELGHLICCLRFGGRVKEVGVAWMLIAPVAYVDLTDLYRMKSRARRVLTCLAGIYIEMIVAAIAVLAWWQSISPSANHLFATIAMTASVGSLLFNLNPLMKLDGYHALSDWIGRPNLANDGAKAMHGFAERFFLGKKSDRDATRWNFVAYGSAVFIYRFVITFGVIAGADAMYGRVGLVIVAMLSLLISLPAMFRVSSRIFTALRTRPASIVRLMFVASCLLGIAGATWMFQASWQSGWCGIVEYSDDSPVRCASTGKVIRVLIEAGQYVEEGDVIVELENLTIAAKREKTESELAAGQARWKRLCELHSSADAATEQESNRAIEVKLKSLQRQEQGLLVRASRSGIVIAMEPNRWLGQWLEEGEPLAYVVDETKKKAIVAVPQDAIEQVAEMHGKCVQFCDSDGNRMSGTVSSITHQAELTPPHPAMAATAGGRLAVRPDKEPGDVSLLSPHLRLEATIDDNLNRLRPGQTLTLIR